MQTNLPLGVVTIAVAAWLLAGEPGIGLGAGAAPPTSSAQSSSRARW